MLNTFSAGSTLRFTAADAISAGDPVIQGVVVGVAPNDVASGAVGVLVIDGAFNLDKLASEAITAGARVFLQAVSGYVTATATNNTYTGITLDAAGSGTTSVPVKLTSALGPQGISGFSGA